MTTNNDDILDCVLHYYDEYKKEDNKDQDQNKNNKDQNTAQRSRNKKCEDQSKEGLKLNRM